MNESDPTLTRYLNGDYAMQNPDWDSSDSKWKADKLHELMSAHNITPKKIVEVGCGAGTVLCALSKYYPDCNFLGFDIAPELQQFWAMNRSERIQFYLADYALSKEEVSPDIILLIDVLEHIGNPWHFLATLKNRSEIVAIHFPLDLSAVSVLRETPLLKVRNKVGHLHFFTKALALSLLEETGYEIIEARFTNAALDVPQRSLKTKIVACFRKLVYSINHDFGARLLGGETLMVLARPRHK